MGSTLSSNFTVRSIRMGYNSIGEKGALNLVKGLEINDILSEMVLDGNSFGEEAAKALLATATVTGDVRKISVNGGFRLGVNRYFPLDHAFAQTAPPQMFPNRLLMKETLQAYTPSNFRKLRIIKRWRLS